MNRLGRGQDEVGAEDGAVARVGLGAEPYERGLCNLFCKTIFDPKAQLWNREIARYSVILYYPLKASTNIRIGFQNIRPQPESRRSNKTYHNAAVMATGSYDVALFAEHYLNPTKLKSGQLWTDRMSMEASTRGSFSSFGYNKQELIRSRWNQVCGTACTVSKQFRSMTASHGVDPRLLGRWSWVQIRGKHDQYTQFVSCYRPRHNSAGTGSVLSQHVRYYREEGIQDPNPRDLFTEEITAAMQT